MIKYIKSLFNKNNIKLEEENKELKNKLVEKQEVINQTNAYWKKKLYALNRNLKKNKL